ncbi:phosphotransferase [Aestuariibius sp. 2305UL40-4]|uniref:phosphotransferase n=1 Tax=Aestuariibius violaceus TaxID=3234132 RepID=UPI00345ED91C
MPPRRESLRVPSQADDAALCTRDPDLPGLASVLEAPTLAHRAGLPPMRHSYLRHKPGTSCVAGLIAEDGQTAWSALCYPADRYAEVRARPSWASALFFDDIQTVLVPLRLERRLRVARALTDPTQQAILLEALGLAGTMLRILRYKPGRRIVLRADGPSGPRAVIKLHTDADAFEAAYDGARHSAAVDGPPLLGQSRTHHAIAVGWLAGEVLTPRGGVSRFMRAGEALAKAHKAPTTDALATWKAQDPIALATSLGQILPHLKTAAHDLANNLSLPDVDRSVPLHGDFSPDQVLTGPNTAQIVDWDRAAHGDLARDLGSFLAALDLSNIRGTPTEAAVEAFLSGYEAASGAIDEQALRRHQAHALFALAQEGFRDRRPNWRAEANAVLDRTRALLSISKRRIIPGLSDALNGQLMGPKIAPSIGKDPQRLKPELVRLKPGRRALIRYALPGGQAVLGKLRAKGLDQRAASIQADLRVAGLDGSSGVGVPTVRGALGHPALWLQTEVPGTPLGLLLQSGDAASALHRTGRALAVLHDTPPQTRTRWTLTDEMDVLRRAIGHGPYADLLSPARQAIEALPQAAPSGLHRDFYFDQVIVDTDVIWLVDLDLHASGDPAIDIANFLAHLIELALRGGGDWTLLEPLGATFLRGYSATRPLPPQDRIDTLKWLSLARHIAIAGGFEERRHTIPIIADLCRDRLGAQPASLKRAAM